MSDPDFILVCTTCGKDVVTILREPTGREGVYQNKPYRKPGACAGADTKGCPEGGPFMRKSTLEATRGK